MNVREIITGLLHTLKKCDACCNPATYSVAGCLPEDRYTYFCDGCKRSITQFGVTQHPVEMPRAEFIREGQRYIRNSWRISP